LIIPFFECLVLDQETFFIFCCLFTFYYSSSSYSENWGK